MRGVLPVGLVLLFFVPCFGFIASCSPAPTGVVIVAPAELQAVFGHFVEQTDGLELRLGDDVAAHEVRVELVPRDDCVECFSLEGEERTWTVRGDAPLGLQYGLSELLERMGLRFLHPQKTFVPEELVPPPAEEGTVIHQPAIERRGLHMHTLHPIEGLFDFWQPSEEGRERAAEVIDWVVKNRGNHLQWVGLDNIETSALARESWREHSQSILDVAHLRGLTVGLGVQLFGSGNLQQAFDLVDAVSTEEAHRASIEERWSILCDGLDFDLFNLSFGEFFGEDPQTFVDSVNLAWEILQEIQPGTEMTTVIHVGEELRVSYQGQDDLLYYFLAAYADPQIIPWIHTVMYFNLFEEALGAYGHEDFAEHRDFLLERLQSDEPVGYFPETAYWVSFDNSVPQHLPLYVRARWLDLAELLERTGRLPRDHVMFSSGWEWGYWLHDRASLRMSFEIPESYESEIVQAYEALGVGGAVFGSELAALVETQRRYHLEEGLSAYLAGRDSGMEFGDSTGIIAQPPRVSLAQFSALDSGERELLLEGPVAGAEALALALEGHAENLRGAGLHLDQPFVAEALDGVDLAVYRARFVAALYLAVDAHLAGEDGDAFLDEANAEKEAAADLVGRRHQKLHYPAPHLLLQEASLPSIYDYGYLRMADTLCYWERELSQAQVVVVGQGAAPPGCLL